MKKILIACATLAFSFMSTVHAETLQQAPAWQLKKQDGSVISTSQYQGKPVILHFWATWCPYCKKLQPTLTEMQKKYKSSGIELVGISFNEDEGALPQDVLAERGHYFATAIDGDTVAALYGVVGTPTTFYINKQGKVVFKSTSSDTTDPRIELAIKEIIK